MALVAASSSSSSSSSRRSETKTYDVFPSFRGEDTRNNFTSHLYADLCRKKIETFIDDDGLCRGEEISRSLLKAIEESKIAIVVFSEGYASSTWCLEELAKIIECKKSGDLIVVPVFYHVDPSDVRKQTGSFGEAFVKHEERFKQSFEKVQKWRAALTETANISGFDSEANRLEAALIEKIVKHILERLNHMSPCYNKDLVGIEPRIKAIESLLNLESKDVILVGIWGMGGIGKTTLARAVFNKIQRGFEGANFLDEVTEESQNLGLSRLRQELLSKILDDPHASLESTFTKNRLRNKKILLVFDNVTGLEQIEKLIGDLECFSPGSRIIITTREKQVLKTCGVKHDNIYEVKGLYYYDSLQLFSRYAFKLNHPIEGYEMLLKRVIVFGKGVPLALKVLGGLLFEKEDTKCWESTLSQLERNPDPKINNVLKLSYDRLNDQERSIFLDITCFFKCVNKDFVEKILEDYCSLGNLVDKALITIEYNRIRMHDLLQDMGRKIVKEEPGLPCKRSRVWREDDICHHVLRTNKSQRPTGCEFSDHFFGHHYSFDYFSYQYKAAYQENEMRVHAPEGLEFASYELRFFRWVGYPLESLPSKFYSKKLVALIMPYSNIKQLSKGLQYSEKLKCINLMHCKHLIRMSDLSLTPNLESLILEGCTNLIEVPPSIRSLNKLVYLNLNHCTSLRSLPTGIRSRCLNLGGCSNLEMAPEITSKVEYLVLDGTAIKELSVIELASRLKILNLRDCSRLERIPDLSLTPNLETLNLQGCRNLIEVPPSIQSVNKLDNLILWGCTSLRSLPTGIRSRSLYLGGCSNLEMAPEITSKVEYLDLRGTAIKELSVIELPSRLKTLTLGNCSRLERIPDLSLTPNLWSLNLEGCRNLIEVPPSIQSLNKLDNLSLSGCTSLRSLPTGIRSRQLQLGGCSNLERAPKITSKMEEVHLDGTAIKELSVIELGSRLKALTLGNCSRLERIPDFSLTPNLQTLDLGGCRNLVEVPPSIQSLNKLDNLILWACTSLRSLPTGIRSRSLDLGGCSNLEMAPEITSKVEYLSLRGTAIKELSVIELASRLETLDLYGCSRLESLPNAICELKSLRNLDVEGCSRLDRLPDGLGKLEALTTLRVGHTAISRVPSLASPTSLGLRSLFSLDLSYCQITELPDNLGELSSLNYLRLRGNYFTCIPASFKKLSNLVELEVRCCKKLQFLPKLSSTSRRHCRVEASCCTSLEKTDWLKSPFEPGEKWSDFELNLANCYKLDQNQVVKDYMDYLPKCISRGDRRDYLECITILPGNEIPDCFDIRNMGGSSLTIKPPLGLSVEQYRLHYAVCVVLELRGSQDNDISLFDLDKEKISMDKYGNVEERITGLCERLTGKDAEENEGHGDHVVLMNDYVDSGIISFTLNVYCGAFGSYEVKKCGVKFIGAEPNEYQDEEDERKQREKSALRRGTEKGRRNRSPKD